MAGKKIEVGVAEATLSIRFREEIVDDGERNFYVKLTPEVKVGQPKLKNFDRKKLEKGIVEYFNKDPNTRIKSRIKVKL